MKAFVPCHWSTPKSASKSSVIVYQGIFCQPIRSFRPWISVWGGARDERERCVPGVEVRRVRNLVCEEGAARAGPLRVRATRLRVRGDIRRVEGAVDDQLAPALEQVEEAGRAVLALEAVLLFDRHPGHAPPLRGQGVAGAGQLLLRDQQVLPGGLPLIGRNDRRCVHSFPPSGVVGSRSTTCDRKPFADSSVVARNATVDPLPPL